MNRVIEHLGLVKMDLRDTISSKVIENSLLDEIVDECKDELRVKLVSESIVDNEDIIDDAKRSLKEIDEAIEILQAFIKMNNKKRP